MQFYMNPINTTCISYKMWEKYQASVRHEYQQVNINGNKLYDLFGCSAQNFNTTVWKLTV